MDNAHEIQAIHDEMKAEMEKMKAEIANLKSDIRALVRNEWPPKHQTRPDMTVTDMQQRTG